MERQDLIIAGVGGQGILTIASVIGRAAVERGLHIKQSEVHGMAQRGGAVVSHVRLSSRPVDSDLIPPGGAAIILALEPMEGLRYLPFAREDAVLVVNRNPVRNVASYPDLDRVLARVRGWRRNVIVDAEALAREAGTHRAVNSVMLGTASPFMILGPDDLAGALGAFLARRGADVVAANLRAFAMGRDAARAANV